MARIIAPNKEYAGVSAGVPFTGGEGNTDNEYLIKWFHDHGYEVIKEPDVDATEEESEEEPTEKEPEEVPTEEPAVAPAQKKRGKKEA